MGIEKQQCPKCGNWVEGKKKQSYTKKIAKTGVKSVVNGAASVGAASTGAAIGSAILPGIGTLVGGAAGFIASTMFHTAVNDGIDVIADGAEEILSDNIQYEYTCPKCGHIWDSTNQISSISNISHRQNTIDSNFDSEREALLETIKQCTKVSYVNEGNSISFINLNNEKNARKLQNRLFEEYKVSIPLLTIQSCSTVRVLIDTILNEICSHFSLSSQTYDQSDIDFEQKKVKEQQEQFDKKFDYFLSEKDNIIKNLQTAQRFITNIGKASLEMTNNVIRSEFFFLQAICCYYYTVEHEDDKSLRKQGEDFIDKAQQCYYDDEYTVFKLIFKSYNIDYESSYIVSMQEKISQSCPDILQIQNTLFKNEYLLQIYENSRHDSLLESCVSLENKKQYREAERCWVMMTELSNKFSKFIGNYYLYTYYLCGKEGIEESSEKCFLYCKNVVDLYDFEEDFDNSDSHHQKWLECLSILGSCYLDGDGTSVDYRKGFELSLKAALLGDTDSMFEVGEVFEYGKGVIPNPQKAMEWYQKAADLGNEDAQLKLKDLSFSHPNRIQEKTITTSEQEYVEEVKICLEEDGAISPKERRLLNRLREKLGISEERAQELELSLSEPHLTDEEKEYIEEYKICLEEDNIISEKERRLLDKLRKMLGISEERAKELETM